MTDQLQAAIEDAERRMEKATAGDEYEELPVGKVIETVVRRFAKGMNPATNDPRGCPHVAASPTVIFGLASIPQVVGCQPCMERLGVLHDLQQSLSGGRRCDHCNGTLSGEPRVGVVQNGVLLLGITICGPCAQLDASTADEKEQV